MVFTHWKQRFLLHPACESWKKNCKYLNIVSKFDFKGFLYFSEACYFTVFRSLLRTHSSEHSGKHFVFKLDTFSNILLKFASFGNNIKNRLDLLCLFCFFSSSWLHSYTMICRTINTRVTTSHFNSLVMINVGVTTCHFDSLLISFQGFLLLFSGLITAIIQIFAVFRKVSKGFWLWFGCVHFYLDVLILVKVTKMSFVARLNRFTFVLLLLDLASKFGAWIWNLFLIAQDLHVSGCKCLLESSLISAIFCILNLEGIFCFHLHVLRNIFFPNFFFHFPFRSSVYLFLHRTLNYMAFAMTSQWCMICRDCKSFAE